MGRKPKTAPETTEADNEEIASDAGKIVDYITNEVIPDNSKETVRQRIARALFHEYGINVDDMERDFRLKLECGTRKVDIAIFAPGTEHVLENLRRVVFCQKEVKVGDKGAYKMRDHEQAKREFGPMEDVLSEVDGCTYGLWTNGFEFFFFQKKKNRFDIEFKPIGDWPMGDESLGSRDVASAARLRTAQPDMLRITFRRCHNYIHGNEGMPKDAAFWQFLYLIFAKMYDEREAAKGHSRRFWAGATEPFEPEGQKAIRNRLQPLFNEVKKHYKTIFRGNEEISLSDRALAFMVSELARYDLGRTDVDAKGAAYQEIVGTNLRGDRGQYFTPRSAIKLMVQMLDPQPGHRVLDPSCGTGGFLVATINHLNKRFHVEKNLKVGEEETEDFWEIQGRLGEFVRNNLFGADFDQFLVRAAQMNALMASNAEARVFHMNSLEFPNGHLKGVDEAKAAKANLGTIDLILTNPPFGADIPITDSTILSQFDLAWKWDKQSDGGFKRSNNRYNSVAPEVLFVERCVQWLKPGGRLGIVLPDGLLGNPGDEYIRWWVLRHCWVLASVDLPVETFIAEANVNILTSLLFLKKKTQSEIQAEDLKGKPKEYPVFMAVAEKVGVDRRGNAVYKREPNGDEILEESIEQETIRIGGIKRTRTLKRNKKILDDDLPVIAEEYRKFRKKNKEPGQ
jgi:type I restriction enzyme M protein